MSATPAIWSRPSRSPNRKNAATAANVANWLPMTAVIGMLSRDPHAESIEPRTSATAGDQHEREGGSRDAQASGHDERDDDDEQPDQTSGEGDPCHGHE